MGRNADKSSSGRFRITFGDRSWIDPFFVDGDVLREGALTAKQSLIGSPDAITHLKSPHSQPGSGDCPSHVATNDVRKSKRHSDHATAKVRIERIDRDGTHSN